MVTMMLPKIAQSQLPVIMCGASSLRLTCRLSATISEALVIDDSQLDTVDDQWHLGEWCYELLY